MARVLPQRDGRRLEEERPLPDDRLHAAHLLVDEPQRHRVLVHHVVEQVATRALVVEPPRVAGRIEVGLELRLRAADHRLDAHDRRVSDDPRGDEVARLAQRWVVARLLRDPEDHARIGRGLHHAPAIRHGVGDRLLDAHVLAGTRGRDHVLRVQRCRTEDLDRVDVGVGEQRIELRIRAIDLPLAGAAFEHVGARIAQRDHVAALVREISRHVERRNVADAHDPDPDPFHLAPHLLSSSKRWDRGDAGAPPRTRELPGRHVARAGA